MACRVLQARPEKLGPSCASDLRCDVCQFCLLVGEKGGLSLVCSVWRGVTVLGTDLRNGAEVTLDRRAIVSDVYLYNLCSS
jgi:hypothetical protein